jgi:hypothetical protein
VNEYEELQAHFMLNVDETCVMANEETIQIIGDKDKKNMKKLWMTIGNLLQ